jgi:hypothetical protein
VNPEIQGSHFALRASGQCGSLTSPHFIGQGAEHMTASLRHNEIVRGKILRYLGMIYPQSATLLLLQGELDLLGYSLTMDELNFHVAYLAEKDLLTVASGRVPRTLRSIPLIKITAKGIDYRDGRLPLDEGIYLEPAG